MAGDPMDLITQKNWFDSPGFEREYHCDAPLGAFCSPDGTVFRLWAPTAAEVVLLLYAHGDGGVAFARHLLTRGEKGLWQFETSENLDGVYYEYQVAVDGMCRVTADPYARSCGINGTRSMVLDLRRTDPDGWQKDKAPRRAAESVIYELHIKDFSWDPAGGFDPHDRGKYTALCHTATTLDRDGIHPTGLNYLKRLGVTHVQLMPVYDYGSVDEGGWDGQFNWGYDPVNYNVPEGSYSSDPWHGEVRVRELKQAIQSLHANGFRVIMDVVYNHTYHLDSWLWRTVPWYYYRQNDNGSASNGSGCGSELASERSMCAKYILDSVLYWAEEYHMDGFRFDLMGMLDVDLLNHIQAALDKRFGKGEKLLYGEAWAGGTCHPRSGVRLCNKDNLRALNPVIGAFCDNTRDAVKGSLMDEKAPGFVNGGGMNARALRSCVTGWAGEDAQFQAPSQTITYLSCHDDWTLLDKLVCTMDAKRRFDKPLPNVIRANKLAAAINLCCQGRPFLHAGEEFGRTKNGVKNSYNASPDLNRLDWNRAWYYKGLVDYYRGPIALRKRLPALLDKSEQAGKRVLYCADEAPDCPCICLDNSGGRSHWDQLLMFFHAGQKPLDVVLPEGQWQVLADGRSSCQWQRKKLVAGSARMSPVSALILGRIPK